MSSSSTLSGTELNAQTVNSVALTGVSGGLKADASSAI